jgi:hypothetical protein
MMIFWLWKVGDWILFGIWDLVIGIWHLAKVEYKFLQRTKGIGGIQEREIKFR